MKMRALLTVEINNEEMKRNPDFPKETRLQPFIMPTYLLLCIKSENPLPSNNKLSPKGAQFFSF